MDDRHIHGVFIWTPIMLALWATVALFFFAPAKGAALVKVSNETTYGVTAMLICPMNTEAYRRNLRWPPVCAQKV